MDARPKHDLRYEIKFLVNRPQQVALLAELREHLQPDTFGDANGQYLVTSLYYDTPDYKAYRDKVDGFDFRRKVRLRSYGDQPILPDTLLFFEIKARVGNRMGKRRLRLSYAEAMALADQDADETAVAALMPRAEDRLVLDELHYLFSALRLQPTAVVSYQRLAYGGHSHYPDLRITFDTAIASRVDNLSLLSTDASATQLLLDPSWAIFEVKVNQTIPFWLGELLSRHGCTPRRLSKYCIALEHGGALRRQQHILLSQ